MYFIGHTWKGKHFRIIDYYSIIIATGPNHVNELMKSDFNTNSNSIEYKMTIHPGNNQGSI